MKIPSHEHRLAFWKFTHARASFIEARVFAKKLIESGVGNCDPINKALSIAIVTVYGRPFKQRKAVRLSAAVVPTKQRETRNTIIETRDKIIAHRDVDGPISDDGLMNRVEIVI